MNIMNVWLVLFFFLWKCQADKQNTLHPLVQFELDCYLDGVFCNKLNQSIGAAIDELTQVVHIKDSILIHIRYFSFCQSHCANQTFGWGVPASQFILPMEENADLDFAYPQALAKQLAPFSTTNVWSEYDIYIDINHDAHLATEPYGTFWFLNDASNPTILPNQVDFRYIVLHELIHGFGVFSAWAAYFWTDESPFRALVDGVIDPEKLKVVTPPPYWFVEENGGPTYLTGFQYTFIFDKYLLNSDLRLYKVAFEIQNFCLEYEDAFIVNFINTFNQSNQSVLAHDLWLSMSKPNTTLFQFEPTLQANSSYNQNGFLNQTYHNMSLLTSPTIFMDTSFEHVESTMNRPGLMIVHLDDKYKESVDFLMTKGYHYGKRLEDLVDEYYEKIPAIVYSNTTYRSPIGPGILRMLDSIGYSTVLSQTNYNITGNVQQQKPPKPDTVCGKPNSSPGLEVTPTPSNSCCNPTLNTTKMIMMIMIITIVFVI